MKEFIQWLEMNYTLVIDKLKKNINSHEDLEADVVINRRILAPSTAVELAEIFEEYLNTIAVLENYEVELPTDVKETIIRLAKADLTNLVSLANAEAVNNGNLAICINAVVNNVPVKLGMFNFDENMIQVNFNSAEGVTI